MKRFQFNKSGNDWYVDLPEYLEQGGDMDDLQMVEGADTMLDIMSGGKDKVVLDISEEKFEGADQLILKEQCHPLKGGGIYIMESFEGKQVGLTLWLCQVTVFVFGKIPERLFVKRKDT